MVSDLYILISFEGRAKTDTYFHSISSMTVIKLHFIFFISAWYINYNMSTPSPPITNPPPPIMLDIQASVIANPSPPTALLCMQLPLHQVSSDTLAPFINNFVVI